MRIKNKDIAEALGISTTAVSLAINNRPGVSEETRRKVLQMISESAARSAESQLSLQANQTVILSVHKRNGLIINEKPFFSELVETIQQEAMQHSYMLAITHYTPEQNLEQYMKYLHNIHADGLIIMATEMDKRDLDAYKKLQIPMVLLDGYFDLESIDSISLDNQIAIYRAFDYAYRMGHRSIGFLKSATPINNFEHHFDGYMKGIRRYGLENFPHPVIELPCQMEEARTEMSRFLTEHPDFVMPTLFLADLDYIALGVMQALREHGFKIPDDVSLIGYDDVPGCLLCTPHLTTTRVNHGDMGRLAMRRLMELLRMGKEEPGYYITTHVSSRLIVRDSVKKLS